jgi:hypothetical protein
MFQTCDLDPEIKGKETYTYIHTYIHTCIHACMHVYMYTCMHIFPNSVHRDKNPKLRYFFLLRLIFWVTWLCQFFFTSKGSWCIKLIVYLLVLFFKVSSLVIVGV